MRKLSYRIDRPENFGERLAENLPTQMGVLLAGAAPHFIADEFTRGTAVGRGTLVKRNPLAVAYPFAIANLVEARRAGDPEGYDAARYGLLTVGGVGAIADAGKILVKQRAGILPPNLNRAAGARLLANLGSMTILSILTAWMRPDKEVVEGVNPGHRLPDHYIPPRRVIDRGRVTIDSGGGMSAYRLPDHYIPPRRVIDRIDSGGGIHRVPTAAELIATRSLSSRSGHGGW